MNGKFPPEVVAGIAAGLAVLLLLLVIYRYLLRICRPNEILIFSGRKHTTSDGRTVGYRVVFGGRGVRIPVVETVSRMDVSLISVPIKVEGAYSEGGRQVAYLAGPAWLRAALLLTATPAGAPLATRAGRR